MLARSKTVRFAGPAPYSGHLSSLKRSLPNAWARRRDPRLYLQLVLLALLGGALYGLGVVVEDYLSGDPLVQWDVEFSRWLHEHTSATLLSAFQVITLGGNVVTLALFTVAVALYLLRRARLNEAAVLGVAAIGIEIVNPILKLAFHRPRPELAFVHLESYSFPSGHAAGSAAIYGVALYLLARYMRPRWQVLAAAGYVVLVGAIGFSRLYLEVHYLSDVLAGTALGAAWSCAWLFVYETRHDLVARLVPGRVRRLATRG